LLLFVAFWLLRKRWPFPGASFLMYMLFYFGGQFFLEFTRGDEAIYLGPWRLAQVLDLILSLLAAAGVLVLWWQNQAKAEESDEPQGPEESESQALDTPGDPDPPEPSSVPPELTVSDHSDPPTGE
jgi:prolipoprotein diacylglyceryltransferase